MEEEFQFFLNGGTSVNTNADLPSNPASDWISDQLWETLNALQKLENFTSIIQDISTHTAEWGDWYREKQPESAMLPREWEENSDGLRRLILLRCFRYSVSDFKTLSPSVQAGSSDLWSCLLCQRDSRCQVYRATSAGFEGHAERLDAIVSIDLCAFSWCGSNRASPEAGV